jgi:hypothetical protein
MRTCRDRRQRGHEGRLKKTPAGAGVEEEMGDTDRIGAPYGTVTVWLTLLVAPSSSVTVNVTV